MNDTNDILRNLLFANESGEAKAFIDKEVQQLLQFDVEKHFNKQLNLEKGSEPSMTPE